MEPFFVVEMLKIVVTGVVFVVLGGPFVYFMSRRLFGGGKAVAALPADAVEIIRSLDGRLTRLENAVDTIAVEVERVTEGQRFTVKLLSEAKSAEAPRLGAG